MSTPDLLEDRIRDAGAAPRTTIDVDALWAGAVRDRRRRTALAAVGAAAVVAAAVALPTIVGVGSPRIDDRPDLAGDGQPTPSSPGDVAVRDGVAAEWDELSKREAVDRLIALTEQGPDVDLPPPDGQALRTHTLYLAEESGWDAQEGAAAAGTSSWHLNEHTLVVDANSDGWSEFSAGDTTRPAGATAREQTRDLAMAIRPAAPGERFRVGRDTAMGHGWLEDYDRTVAGMVDAFSPSGWLDVEQLGHVAMDTSARVDALRLLADADGVRYEGMVPDLTGRLVVAFSHPHVSTTPQGQPEATEPGEPAAGGSGPSLPPDADVEQVRSWVFFSPEDGEPRGWEYFDPEGVAVEWRSQTLLDAQLVPFDPASVQDLPADDA